MFHPEVTTLRFDRHLFNGDGELLKLTPKELAVDILFYYAGNVVVGTITSEHPVKVYWAYARHGFLPIELRYEGVDFCGWVEEQKIGLVAN